jgi:thioredoxin reductase
MHRRPNATVFMKVSTKPWDVIIVGAGPAGLSAALILGRCRRRVLLVDTNRPRNAASRALHGFLTRDGIDPSELRRLGREELAPYDTVRIAYVEARAVRRLNGGFQLTLSNGRRPRCRKLLLSTGVVDDLPAVDGIEELYGRSVFHCPYCDAWECRDQPLAVYGKGTATVVLTLSLRIWSRDLVVCTDGARLSSKDSGRLAAHRIALRQDKIARLEGSNGRLERIVFANGDALERRFMFFSSAQHQASELAAKLGCTFTRKGVVQTGEYEVTNIRGLYVAGDASRVVQLAIIAAAEGAKAAFAINTALLREDHYAD